MLFERDLGINNLFSPQRRRYLYMNSLTDLLNISIGEAVKNKQNVNYNFTNSFADDK